MINLEEEKKLKSKKKIDAPPTETQGPEPPFDIMLEIKLEPLLLCMVPEVTVLITCEAIGAMPWDRKRTTK